MTHCRPRSGPQSERAPERHEVMTQQVLGTGPDRLRGTSLVFSRTVPVPEESGFAAGAIRESGEGSASQGALI
jgi:hypothetical protein